MIVFDLSLTRYVQSYVPFTHSHLDALVLESQSKLYRPVAEFGHHRRVVHAYGAEHS